MNFETPFRFAFADTVVLKEKLFAVEVGTVTTGEPGSEVQITLRQDGERYLFDFVIPRGADGQVPLPDDTMRDDSHNAVENAVIKTYVDQIKADLTATRYVMTDANATVTLKPNTLYIFPEMRTLSISLGGTADPSVVQEYRFRFTSGATATTLTLPASVMGDLTVEANRIYEISILDNYLVSQSWEVNA